MMCQACGKNPATTHVKTIRNGELKEFALCADCARKMGYGSLFSGFGLDLGSLLGGFLSETPGPTRSELRCPGCGSTFEDIVKSGRAGCAECYHTFYEKLLPTLQRLHGNTRHRGKRPAGGMLQVRPVEGLQIKQESALERKRRALKEAVAGQNYEEAAKLRDEIREMEAGGNEKMV